VRCFADNLLVPCRCILTLFLVYASVARVMASTPDPSLTTDQIVASADAVLKRISVNNVQAAKEADAIFLAANRLVEDGEPEKSIRYFEAGLQLSPWDMAQQMNYAEALGVLGEPQRAAGVARLVAQTTETASLLHRSQKLAGIPTANSVALLPEGPFEHPVIVLVRVGDVAQWILQQAGQRLQDTLGTPVYVLEEVVQLPPYHRSYFQRWSEQIKDNIVWDHPYIKWQMRDLSIASRETATLDETLELLARISVAQGEDDPRASFPELKRQIQAQDQQWDAKQLWGAVQQIAQERENAIFLGITQADIYTDDNNFVFGLADIGAGYAIVSTRRFEAQFNGERENQQRFLDRLHKQLLSSVGFAFGIARPTDPRSARSYPNGLADHDLKGTWLSREDLEAFEEVLGHKLPQATWDASKVHW
jgi:predicted Zn-dependent protease